MRRTSNSCWATRASLQTAGAGEAVGAKAPPAAGWEVLVRACMCGALPWIEERTSACVCVRGSPRGQLSCSRLRRHRRELAFQIASPLKVGLLPDQNQPTASLTSVHRRARISSAYIRLFVSTGH